MYQKTRITVAALAVMMICILSSGSSLSYFTDTDTKSNDFVVGNASTVLSIYDDTAAGSENLFDASEYVLRDNLNIPFYPQASNDGNILAYQRFRVVIPIGLREVITLNLPTMDNSCLVDATITSGTSTCKNADYTVTYKPSVNVGTTPTYAEYYILSNDPLAVGDVTAKWPVTGIHIGALSEVDNSLFTCTTGNNDCVLGVNVYSDVMQTTGFADAASAFASLVETYN